jgi:hypothetical protein
MSKRELNQVQVKVGGDLLTIGELKAKHQEIANLGARELELTEARERLDLDRSDTYRRITAIVDAFPPGSVPSGLVAALEERHQQTKAREAAMLSASRPEWADPKYSGAQRERMARQAAKYGFGKGEVANLLDHRMVLLLQDFTNLSERVDKARAEARRVGERPGVTPSGDRAAVAQVSARDAKSKARYRSSQSIASEVSKIIARR